MVGRSGVNRQVGMDKNVSAAHKSWALSIDQGTKHRFAFSATWLFRLALESAGSLIKMLERSTLEDLRYGVRM